MYVRTGSLDDEVKVTVDAVTAITNLLLIDDLEPAEQVAQVRAVLIDHDFVRARSADDDEFADLVDRMIALARLMIVLPDAALSDAVAGVNHQLAAAAVAPSLLAHDGAPLHIHWTAATTPFSHQIVVDGLMALAQTLCDHGLERFGRCGAEGCARVFYDATRNRSRRFCDDPRCASRTHTAAHRARTRHDATERDPRPT